MDKNIIREEMKVASKNSNYEKVVVLFSSYLRQNPKDDYEILSIYQEALMKLDKKEEELSILLKLSSAFKNSYYSKRLVNLYLDLGNAKKAINVFDNSDKLKYYTLGKIYYLRGEYEESLNMFKTFLDTTTDINYVCNAKGYINRINKHLKDNTFLKMYYEKFKAKGNRLEPGYIIYSDKVGNKYNLHETNLDPHKQTRPYLVWKVNPEHVFVLPITTSISDDSYVLKKEDYINLKSNSTIFENFILLKDEDITTVVDHLTKEDYLNITRFIYEKILSLNKEDRKTEKVFISNYMKRMKIKDNDIIMYRDNGKNIESYFFIISSDDYKYETIPVKKQDNSFMISNRNKISINKKKPIYSVIKLSEEEKADLIYQLESAYLIQDLCGKRISTKDKEKFVILHDLKDDYLAVSIPYSSSYARFKLIPKNIEVSIDGEISQEELEKLRYLLDDNIKVRKICIPGYTNEKPHIKTKSIRYKEKK